MSFCSNEDEMALTGKRIAIPAEEESEHSELTEPMKARPMAMISTLS